MGHGHSGKQPTPLGSSDVVAGVVFFVLFTGGLYALAGALVPGLFSPKALTQALISGAMFLAVWFVVGKTVFRPYFDLLIQREARTLGDEKLSHELVAETRALEAEIEESLRQARLEGVRRRDSLVTAAKEKAAEMAHAVSVESEDKLRTARREIAELKRKTGAEVEREANSLADLVITRALDPIDARQIH